MSHYEVQNLLLDIQLKTKLLEIRLSVTWELGPPVGPTLSCLFKNLTESVAGQQNILQRCGRSCYCEELWTFIWGHEC